MNPNGAAADAKGQAEESVEQLQQRCAELTAERDQLRQELADIKRNYAAVRASLFKLMDEKVEVNLEELLAQTGKGPSMEQLLDELEAKYGLKGDSCQPCVTVTDAEWIRRTAR